MSYHFHMNEITKHDDDDYLMTLREVANMLRVSTRTVRNKINAGLIPGTKVGRQYRIFHSAVLASLNVNKK